MNQIHHIKHAKRTELALEERGVQGKLLPDEIWGTLRREESQAAQA
jgi:hypothetical protein